MKIVNKHKHLHGKDVYLAHLGKTTIPTDGILEVEDHVGQMLVHGTNGQWAAHGVPEKEEATNESLDTTTVDELLASLDDMDLEELVATAEAAGIKLTEKAKTSEKVLKAFIKNKLKKG